jgi:predicted nucleotide-binding protein (sugar kinase/HSP70/actin superfamily)
MKRPLKELAGSGKVVHIPYVSDHSYGVAAAFEHAGVKAKVLDAPTPSSFSLGLEHCSGRECLPFVIMAGDLVKWTTRPDFDPAIDVFFCPLRSDSCKHSLWGTGFQKIIQDTSHTLDCILPTSSIVGDGVSDELGIQFATDVFWATRAFDYLDFKRCEVRPKEKNPGDADETYLECSQMIAEGIKTGQARKALQNVVNAFDEIPIERKRLPVVAILGDDYTKVNRFANHNMVQMIEELGGQAFLQSFCLDATRLQTHQRPLIHWRRRDCFGCVVAVGAAWTTEWLDRCIHRTYRKSLEHRFQFDYRRIVAQVGDYVSPDLEADLIAILANAIYAIETGVDGLVHLLTLNCMIGNMAAVFLEIICDQLDGPPLLNLNIDGHYSTDMVNRIEAFMYQVRQHHDRKVR